MGEKRGLTGSNADDQSVRFLPVGPVTHLLSFLTKVIACGLRSGRRLGTRGGWAGSPMPFYESLEEPQAWRVTYAFVV